ncbi:uncharacterized protein [Elaeis guineensis]|uniref:uncharacterized protein n=1 Tax=Elaeis guineensis var. tenera TaxID=51953 RepID=UPI003C6D92A0
MTGDKSIFVDIDSSSISQVKMKHGALVQARGKGTIAIDTKKGRKLIYDVLLVPDLTQNLLSVGQLIEHGHMVYFENNRCKIYDKGEKKQLMANINIEKNRSFPLILYYAKNVAWKMEMNVSHGYGTKSMGT